MIEEEVKSRSPLEKAERLAEKLIERYSEGEEKDQRKVKAVIESLDFIKKHEQSLRNTPSGFMFDVSGLVVSINPRQKQCVTITLRGNVVSTGPFREIVRLIESSLVLASERFCSHCSREHMKYGMEIEFNHLRNQADNQYRTLVLRRLNGKMNISTSGDMFGIDGGGGGGPTEIRHINGNNVDELIGNLTGALNKFRDEYAWAKKELVGFREDSTVTGCGIHIHMFHKGIPRDKVLIAHTIISLIVNGFDSENISQRARSGYGLPFVNRQAEWCPTPEATELRCLNTVHPEVLKFAMEKFESILGRDFKMTTGELSSFCEDSLGVSMSEATVESPELLIAYFVSKGVISEEEAEEIVKWLEKNYKGVNEILCAK